MEFSNFTKAGKDIVVRSNRLRYENTVLSGNAICLGNQGNEDGKVNI